jgi:hypothetical protein
VTPSSPIVLAAGNVTRTDRLSVELVGPPDTPPVILVRWPPTSSVAEPSPKALASIATSVVRILADAQAHLATR